MSKIFFIIAFLILGKLTFSQNSIIYKDGGGFNSIFQNLDNGKFEGTVNGLLIIENDKKVKTLYDFQGSSSNLEIVKDSFEVYDVSYKNYKGKTTSGKTEIKYKTYATANGFSIKINNEWFEFTGIDGACDASIKGLDYSYQLEKEKEYLTIWITKDIELSNRQDVFSKRDKTKEFDYSEIEHKIKSIKLLKNSTLVFAIKRTNR